MCTVGTRTTFYHDILKFAPTISCCHSRVGKRATEKTCFFTFKKTEGFLHNHGFQYNSLFFSPSQRRDRVSPEQLYLLPAARLEKKTKLHDFQFSK